QQIARLFPWNLRVCPAIGINGRTIAGNLFSKWRFQRRNLMAKLLRARTLFAFLILATALVAAPRTLTQSLPAQALPTAAPAEEGFAPERLAFVDRFYSDAIERGDLAGIVILVSR